MANLTESQKNEIRIASENSCLAKGYTRFVDNPVTGTPMPNPAFTACTASEYSTALKAADQGKLQEWLNNSRDFVKSSGGVTGILQGVGDLAKKIQELKAAQMGTYPPGADPNAYPGKEKGTSPLVWVFLSVIIVLLIVLIVVMSKKKAA